MVLLVLGWDWVPGQIGRVGIGTTRTQLRSEKEQARRRLLYELPLPTTSPTIVSTCLPETQIPKTPKHTFQVSGTYWAVCLHFGSHGTLQSLLHPLSTNTSFIPTYVHTQNPHMAPRSYIGATGTYQALYLHCESQKLLWDHLTRCQHTQALLGDKNWHHLTLGGPGGQTVKL